MPKIYGDNEPDWISAGWGWNRNKISRPLEAPSPFVEREQVTSVGGLTSRSSLNSTQRPLSERQRNVTAHGKPIPILYGEGQVGGDIFALNYKEQTGVWTIGYLVSLGELDSYSEVLLNGEAPLPGVSINYYTGTTAQTTDILLSNAIAGYDDNLVISTPDGDIGVAYIVIVYNDSDYSGWPRVLITAKGKKVWNPATATTIFSENAALHLADLWSSPIYGHGYTVDDTALESVMDDNDDASIGEIRRKSYLHIDSVSDTDTWIDVLKTYANCFGILRGNTIFMLSDKAASSVMTITTDDIVAESMKITKNDSSDVPTVMRVSYTDMSTSQWRERLCDPAKLPGVDTGVVPWRESRVRLDGINRHSQAYREAVERLNKLNILDTEARWQMFDEGLALEIGDIVTVTHPYGFESELLRIIQDPRQVSPGTWSIRAKIYDPSVYSDEIVEHPIYVDPELPGTGTLLKPENIVVTELNTITGNGYQSRMVINWDAPSSGPRPTSYFVEVYLGQDLIFSGETSSRTITTGPLPEGETFDIQITSKNVLYPDSLPAYASYTLVGDTNPPEAPFNLYGNNIDGVTSLWWDASTTAGVAEYELRYGPDGDDDWDAATVIVQTPSLNYQTTLIPTGTWQFYVKAISLSGTYSDDYATVTLDIIGDIVGFVDPLTRVVASLNANTSDMEPGYRWSFEEKSDEHLIVATDWNETWDTVVGATAFDTITGELLLEQTAPGSTDSSAAAGVNDWFATAISGAWEFELPYNVYSETAFNQTGISTWSTVPTMYAGTVRSGTGDTGRISVISDDDGFWDFELPSGSLYVNGKDKEEGGQSTSNAGSAKTITLTNLYSVVSALTITPLGSTALYAVTGNIVYGTVDTTFDVYIFDGSGTQVANDFLWNWKGV